MCNIKGFDGLQITSLTLIIDSRGMVKKYQKNIEEDEGDTSQSDESIDEDMSGSQASLKQTTSRSGKTRWMTH